MIYSALSKIGKMKLYMIKLLTMIVDIVEWVCTHLNVIFVESVNYHRRVGLLIFTSMLIVIPLILHAL